MGGDIVLLESEPGSGSTFRISVALDTTTSARRETAKPTAKPTEKPGALLAGMRILLAEDSPNVYRPLRKLLQLSGCSVEVGRDGETAVTRGHAGSFDLILMDLRMPKLDGFSATARLRAMGTNVPILALTALSSPEDRQRCIEAGCDGHVQKPIGFDALAARLAEYRPS
jgi:CheY-like chemotaxis protein